MSKLPEEWEQQLKEKPFEGMNFTPQMQKKVEQRLGGYQPKPKRYKVLAYAAVLLPVMAMMLWFGYSGLEPGKLAGRLTPLVSEAPQPLETGAADFSPAPTSNNQSVPSNDYAVGIRSIYNAEVPFPSVEDKSAEVSIPLAAVLSVPVLDDGNSPAHVTPPPLPKMTFPLPAGMEDKLQAALVFQGDTGSAYILLAPAGWKASAITGANGSLGATFEDPDNPGQTLQYSDNAWGCQGCAVGSIGTYFPGKAEWADEYGLTIIPPAFTEQYMAGTGGADARTVRYSLPAEASGYETAGTAYYDEGEWGYLFRKLEITTSSAFDGQDVIDSIQGFFAAHHGPLLLPAAQNPESAAGSAEYTTQSLYLALEQRGMQLSLVPDTTELMFNKQLAGVWPEELLIDKTDTPARPDRLSVYTYADSQECAEGLAALKLEINRTTNDGGMRIYPHVFREGKFLVVYWMGGDSAEPYVYDKTIKLALHSLEGGSASETD
ncbi:DUF4850 domain-containing protein [Paenibacillus sp. FSL R5-0912]|uniref:DUF4850 domain-containing protein n=1 Tax=Paenibacillus sp. FSL R5-0912 TaxID=1536771 RepID=UPI0004F672B7|nr:DUF4850 domain-containing protein [Paenibacillus sp. FSL R5-0912]AIQ40959.1 hypothetical protein R50912_13680 [Paenibacillus sp. FSL R5-0912]